MKEDRDFLASTTSLDTLSKIPLPHAQNSLPGSIFHRLSELDILYDSVFSLCVDGLLDWLQCVLSPFFSRRERDSLVCTIILDTWAVSKMVAAYSLYSALL